MPVVRSQVEHGAGCKPGGIKIPEPALRKEGNKQRLEEEGGYHEQAVGEVETWQCTPPFPYFTGKKGV